MRSLPTVQIKDAKRGFLVINEVDFDPKKHEIYDPEQQAPELTSIAGIGKKTAATLADAGVSTIEDLVAADAAELSEATGISHTQIEGWQKQAAE